MAYPDEDDNSKYFGDFMSPTLLSTDAEALRAAAAQAILLMFDDRTRPERALEAFYKSEMFRPRYGITYFFDGASNGALRLELSGKEYRLDEAGSKRLNPMTLEAYYRGDHKFGGAKLVLSRGDGAQHARVESELKNLGAESIYPKRIT